MIKKGQLGENAAMPSRKRLNHRGPLSIDISSAWYFITICAEGHRPWVCRDISTVGGDHRAPRDENDNADAISFLDSVNAV